MTGSKTLNDFQITGGFVFAPEPIDLMFSR